MGLTRQLAGAAVAAALLMASHQSHAAPRKAHTVVLGAARKVPYTKTGDPAGAAAQEDSLRIRALLVDGVLKEWTTGDAHDVTDRSFVVRRVLRLNDALPGEASVAANSPSKPARWVWQRGPWLLVDRVTGHIAALKLPHYDPGVSQVSWFRDYAAYCGVTPSGKSLYAVVAQVEARKPVLAKKLAPFHADILTPSAHPPSGSASHCASPSIPPARRASASMWRPARPSSSRTPQTTGGPRAARRSQIELNSAGNHPDRTPFSAQIRPLHGNGSP